MAFPGDAAWYVVPWLSCSALVCPAWDPNSPKIPSVLVNELRLPLSPSILANSADRFGFIFTHCTPQPAAEIGCLHLLACLPVLVLPSHLSPASSIACCPDSAAAQTDRLSLFTSSPNPSQLLSPLSFPVLNCEIPLMGRNRLARPSC